MDIQEPALFLRGRLHEGLYCGRKGKRYAMEVVTTAEKLPPDDLEDIKDNSGEAQNQQDSDRDKKQKTIPRWLLSWKISWKKIKDAQAYCQQQRQRSSRKSPGIRQKSQARTA